MNISARLTEQEEKFFNMIMRRFGYTKTETISYCIQHTYFTVIKEIKREEELLELKAILGEIVALNANTYSFLRCSESLKKQRKYEMVSHDDLVKMANREAVLIQEKIRQRVHDKS